MDVIKKPRGTMDILPPQTGIWNYIEKITKECAERFGFSEIRTPTFEDIGLFSRGVGEGTDVVQKEMYVFKDKEDRTFALRPEGTASVARALIENGRLSDTMPIKLYYNINCFRYEKPQAGRSREFFQFGCEMYGAADAAADFTVISLAHTIIKSLGIKNVKLHINSIGCPECRPTYRAALIDYLTKNSDKLCDTCKGRIGTNPMRVLDCKADICKEVSKDAPRTIDYLCDDCKNHLTKLKRLLDECGIEYSIDTSIVRGLDYYTRTVFEFIAEGIGAQSTVCGGGRYDGLMKELGGPSLPGIGFAMGITRLILAMEESGVIIPESVKPSLYVASLGEDAMVFAQSLVTKLRVGGVYAESDTVGRSLKAQMKYADKIGAMNVLIVGDSEIEAGKAQLKNMTDSTQREVDIKTPDALLELFL